MNTLEEKMAELKAKHKQEEAEEMLRLSILERLPTEEGVDSETDWRVFLSKLYGRSAMVTRKTGRHEVEYKGATPWSVQDLRECLELLPPMRMAHVQYTFTTFSQLPLCKELEDKKAKVTELSIPLYIKLRPGQEAKVVWFAQLGEAIVEVIYPIPWQHKWMQHDWRRVNYSGGFRYEGSGSWLDIKLPFGGSSVKWGRGGDEYMGETTKYWTRPEFTLVQLLNSIEEAENE